MVTPSSTLFFLHPPRAMKCLWWTLKPNATFLSQSQNFIPRFLSMEISFLLEQNTIDNLYLCHLFLIIKKVIVMNVTREKDRQMRKIDCDDCHERERLDSAWGSLRTKEERESRPKGKGGHPWGVEVFTTPPPLCSAFTFPGYLPEKVKVECACFVIFCVFLSVFLSVFSQIPCDQGAMPKHVMDVWEEEK